MFPRHDEPGVIGHAAVDEVLADLDRLEETPVHEHVATFEAAQERLRALLADAGDQSPAS
jgi:hypothetical protein